MALQSGDFQAGFDPTSQTQLTQAQLLQMMSQMVPLSNMGGVIFQSSTPDVATNTRFSRYIWLDSTSLPPVLKVYDGSAFGGVSPAAGTVTTASIADLAVILTKMAYASAADLTKAKYVLRIKADGLGVEVVALETGLSEISGGIGLSLLSTSGASEAGKFLRWSGSALDYSNITPAVDFTAAKSNLIPPASLSPGAVSTQLVTDSSGVVGWAATAFSIPTAGVTLDKLGNNTAGGGAPSDLQVPTYTAGGGAAVWTTPKIAKEFSHTFVTANVTHGTSTDGRLPAATTFVRFSVAHGLAAIPKQVEVVLVNVSADQGYASGEEIELDALRVEGGAGDRQGSGIMIRRDANTIAITANNLTAYRIFHATTGADANITPANWQFKVRAWA